MLYRFPDFNNGNSTMPTIQCPHCSHEARVPSLEQIVEKTVKCPSCSQTFYVEAEAPAANTGNAPAFSVPPPEIDSPQPNSTSASLQSHRKESFFSPLTYDPIGATSSQRYHNLMRYLLLNEILNTLLLRVSIVLLSIGFVVAEIVTVAAVGQLGVLYTLLMMIAVILLTALSALLLWLSFISYMAFLEFLRVVVNIEDNTRG